ncbi:MAG TPA: Hpt domain-containing protein [Luteimonas sp.]|nr:Hpt domain-containing protein [Luteimonas sp.]
MTALRDAIDYTTLGWVKPELDETLRQARIEIEGFVDDPADTSRMRFCASYLHQVQGTLRMVELYAPAMVTEEMERLAQALQHGEVTDRDAACATLMRGVVLLPDYLERLQSGHKDIPIVLLPLLNELRAARGEAGLSESVLFAPDLARPLPTGLPAAEAGRGRGRNAEVLPLLERLSTALAAWPEDGAPKDAVEIGNVIDALFVRTEQDETRRMLWVAGSVATALRDGAIRPSPGLRQAFASVQREARRQFEDDGFGIPRPETTLEPTRQLLYHVAHSDGRHAALQELRETFDLDAAQPTESEISHAQGSLSGRNRALLDTVAAAVKEDLLRVKDVLDLHLRTNASGVNDLQPQVEALGRVADTLGMLGLGVARNVVQQQRDAMDAIVRGDRVADEGALLDVAGALLYVDATLDDQVARLGDSDAGGSQDDLFSNESRKVLEVIAREAIANFADARQAFVAFVETSWDHNELAEVPRLLQEVAGAMAMLELPQPAAYLTGVRMYTEVELLGRKRVPNGRQLDTFADALASLEYYLEALRENRLNRDSILDIARASLESLGYWPLPEVQAPAIAAAQEADAEAEAATDASPVEAGLADDVDRNVAAFIDRSIDQARASQAAAAPEPQQPAAPAHPAAPVSAHGEGMAGGFETTGDEIDDEIREVFLEEFGEEIDNLDKLLPVWREQPEDMERLRPIRRVFHTLKGSGRLVGARALGEFSWKVENMLNRVLDGTRAASPAVIAMVDQAFYTLPQLLAALRGTAPVAADLEGMQALADRIAEGEEAFAVAPSQAKPDAAPAATPAATPAEPTPEPLAATAEGTLPASVDALLLEILDAEVAGHLSTVDAWLSQAQAAPTPASDALLRAVHTMNGAFAMTEVPAITDALSPAEAYIRRMLAARREASGEGVAALGELAGLIRATVTALHATAPQVPTCVALAAQLVALRDSLPEATVPAEPAAMPEPVEHLADAGAELVDVDLSAYADAEATLAGDAAREAERTAAEQAEAERAEAERLAAEQAEAERVEAERVAAEQAEADRIEAERVAAEQAEAERVEAERLAAEQAEADRLEAERVVAEQAEAERVEAERLAAEQAETQRVEAERLAAEQAEADRVEAERLAAEQDAAARAAAEQAETDRIEAERLEAERVQEEARLAAEQVEAERLASQRAEAERLAEEEREYARLEAEYAEAARLAAEQAEAERLAAEQAEAERVEAERLAAEQAEAERVEAERLAAEQAEAERVEAERLAAEQAEAERLEAERLAAEQAEAQRLEAERLAAEQAEAERLETERLAAAALAVEPASDAAAQPADAAAVVEPADIAPARVVPAFADPDAAFDLDGLDPELVDIFVEEAGDLLDHSDGLLAQLRESPSEREPLVGLQRDLHTIKGGARMAGIMAVGELGHAMESLLEAVVELRRELGRDGIPLLERGFDRLHAMVTRVGARRAIDPSEALIEEFNARAQGRPVEMPAEDAAVRVPAPKVELKPLSAPIGDAVAGDDDDIGVRAPQEQVRIRADLLDKLVNYAGEVAIYRARLEQQLGAFRNAMGEMEQTNMRLRDQLRRLDIETEAQIIARYQREHEAADATFDPLELDRFSTLQQLSRALAESAADMSSLQGTLDDLTRQYETLLLQQSRVSSDLQQGLMRTRMVPFDALVPRLRRVVRQAAGETGKQVQLRLDGAQGELDRNVLERMTAPLEHMLRNAVAHGLETPEQRRKAKKGEEGTVRIAVRREGSEVVLEVGDDGRGLDRAAIRRRGEERGLVRADAVLADSDLDALIFEPGFSTADEVSRLAGRGVGMDVVASEVRQLGGTLDIASRKGEGTTFTLRLPQTLAVTQAVFVRIGETSFAVPIASVRGVGRIARDEFGQADASYGYGGEDYAVHDLGGLVGHGAAKAEGQLQMPLLLIRSGDLRAAVAVDQIVGSREIVVKPVGPQVASIPGIFGATVMGDGSVVVILDVAPLVRRRATQPREAEPAAAVEAHRVPLVMVVDDSVTMRKVTGRVLERHNFEVASARDGIDALERMAERVPDLMLLDIEMPRMDGYELATAMKADPRLRNVPIVMITSRTGEKHRQRAFEIGVERYLGKPYQEHELVRNVYELLKLQPRGDV